MRGHKPCNQDGQLARKTARQMPATKNADQSIVLMQATDRAQSIKSHRYLHHNFPMNACADVGRVCVFGEKYGEAARTHVKEGLRLVAE